MTNKTLLYISECQVKLDSYIGKAKKIDQNDEFIINKKIVAFFVELGEFINEEKSFKYWSLKPASAKRIILEEYIDGIHFLISLGNNIDYDFKKHKVVLEEQNIIHNYLELISNLSDFIKNRDYTNYQILLNSFLSISKNLNFSEEEILESYNIKNKENFARQNNGY